MKNLISNHIKNTLKGILTLTALLTISTSFAQSMSQPDVHFSVAFDSAYVSEGRDNLGDGGLASYEIGADFGSGFSAGIWAAKDTSDQLSYQETNYFAEYGFDLASLEAYVGYTHLSFNDGSNDNEFGFGLATTDLPLSVGLDYVYSAQAEGGFIELSLSKDFETSMGIALTPYLLYALDYGYASESYDGHNNTQIGLEASYAISEKIEAFGYFSKSAAGQDVKNDNLGDESWAGIGFSFSL